MFEAIGRETPDAAPFAEADLLRDRLAQPEVREALRALLDRLPQLTEMAVQVSDAYAKIRDVVTDPVFAADLKNGFEEFAAPVKEKAKELASAAIEAQERANADTRTIGLFGLLRMLRDPQAQKAFRFAKALLATLNDKDAGRMRA
ncbi:DUF1641 domain-containing protein [Cohnella caldifontis]|uniref:DUF1641 domain-containing protein n=1 Tax=Cohnella caldifontis TaxID=3027471 RepID=UPI0023ED8D2A|nr:DUF1641 domain-containing protein [Cohnella sp. YIM B05605]